MLEDEITISPDVAAKASTYLAQKIREAEARDPYRALLVLAQQMSLVLRELLDLLGETNREELIHRFNHQFGYENQLDDKSSLAYGVLRVAIARMQPTYNIDWVRSMSATTRIPVGAVVQHRSRRLIVIVVELSTGEGLNVSNPMGYVRFQKELEAGNVVDAYRLWAIHAMDPVV